MYYSMPAVKCRIGYCRQRNYNSSNKEHFCHATIGNVSLATMLLLGTSIWHSSYSSSELSLNRITTTYPVWGRPCKITNAVGRLARKLCQGYVFSLQWSKQLHVKQLLQERCISCTLKRIWISLLVMILGNPMWKTGSQTGCQSQWDMGIKMPIFIWLPQILKALVHNWQPMLVNPSLTSQAVTSKCTVWPWHSATTNQRQLWHHHIAPSQPWRHRPKPVQRLYKERSLLLIWSNLGKELPRPYGLGLQLPIYYPWVTSTFLDLVNVPWHEDLRDIMPNSIKMFLHPPSVATAINIYSYLNMNPYLYLWKY